MFRVHLLSKNIRDKKVLKEVSFEVGHGKIAIFLGESGAGKSTILRILNNLETYETGSFTLDGSVLDLKNKNHENAVGMVFQHFNLFEHLSAEDNIILTLTKFKGVNHIEARRVAQVLLKRYGLECHAKTNAGKLSGGQKQRLAIARTLAINPKIVCLDEPTSALDPRLTGQVAQSIKGLAAENRIVIVTTHDMELLKQLDGELFLMEEGAIVESALKKDFLSYENKNSKIYMFLNCF